MVHFIFMDHKNFDVCFILFRGHKLYLASWLGVASSASLSICWLSLYLVVVVVAVHSFFFSLLNGVDRIVILSISSFNFFHTHTFIFDIFLRIVSSIYTNYCYDCYYYCYQLYWPFRFVRFVLFRFVPFRHCTARLSSVRFGVIHFFLFHCILNEITPKKASTVVQPN